MTSSNSIFYTNKCACCYCTNKQCICSNLCFGLVTCTTIGGRSSDIGDVISGDICPGTHVLQVMIQQLEMDVAIVKVVASLVVVMEITI